MGFEPQVEKSISRHRHRRRIYDLIVITPIVVFILISLIFMAVNLASSGGDKQESLFDTDSDDAEIQSILSGLRMISVLLPLFAILVFMFQMGQIGYTRLVPVLKDFNSFTMRAPDYNHHHLQRFQDSLHAVSIGSGIPTPALAVLNCPTANAVAFRKKGTVAIGVTRELLEAGLSAHEVEAVMAHEVSHIVSGDELRSPNAAFCLGGAIYVVITVVLCLFFAFTVKDPTAFFTVSTLLLPLLALASAPLSLNLMMRPYSISKLNPVYFHNDIFADSVAVKLTGNPGALTGAIVRLTGLMNSSLEMPKQKSAFTQLFIGPLKRWILDMPHSKWQVSRDEYRAFREDEMDSFISWENRLLEARLRNLNMIEMNKWEAFQVRGGRPIVPPDKWFR